MKWGLFFIVIGLLMVVIYPTGMNIVFLINGLTLALFGLIMFIYYSRKAKKEEADRKAGKIPEKKKIVEAPKITSEEREKMGLGVDVFEVVDTSKDKSEEK